jgi:hypothetical protein
MRGSGIPSDFSASSAKCVGEIDPESPRSDVNLLKVVHNRPIREWVGNSSEKRTVVGNFLFVPGGEGCRVLPGIEMSWMDRRPLADFVYDN